MPSAIAEPAGAPRAAAQRAVGLGGTRLAWVAGWMAAGITLQRVAPVTLWPFLWAVGAAALALLAAVARGRLWKALAALAVLCFAAAWAGARLAPPGELWASLALQDRPLVEVEGVIAAPVRRTLSQQGALAAHAPQRRTLTRSVIAIERVRTAGGWQACRGRLWLRVDDPAIELSVGQRVRAMGVYAPLRGPLNPGEPDTRPAAAQRGIVGSLLVPDDALVKRRGPAGGRWGVIAWWSAMERRGLAALGVHPERDPLIAPDHRGAGRSTLAALTLGQPLSDHDPAFEPLVLTGVMHLLAVSGMHLVLLVGMAAFAVRCTGDRPRLRVLVVLAVMALYTLLVPVRAPILRAALMSAALLLGRVGRRRYPPLNLLGLAAMVAMLLWPADLFAPGFQLSFLVVASLIVGVPAVREAVSRWRDPAGLAQPLPMPLAWTRDALVSGVVAWLVSLPIVWCHFGVIAWLGILLTVLATPVVGLMLGWGFVSVLVGMVWPAAGALLGDGAATAMGWIDSAIALAASRPGVADHAALLPAPVAALSVALMFLAMLLVPRGVAIYVPRRDWLASVAAMTLAWALLVGGAWRAGALEDDVVLRWDAVAVGDGSCHVLRTREGAVLFDAGSLRFDLGLRTVPQAAKATGRVPIPTAIVTHPDTDHFSLLLDAAGPLGVRRVLVGPSVLADAQAHPEGAAASLLVGLAERSIGVAPCVAGDTIDLGAGVSALVVHPPNGFAARNDNEHSLALLIEVPTSAGPRRVLMTGDLAGSGVSLVSAGWRAMGGPAIHAMEAPHHGAAAAEAIALVEELDPLVVVQSTGPSRLDDPRWARVREARHWLATAERGCVTLTIARDGSVRVRGWVEPSTNDPRARSTRRQSD
jgi:competence protein ComEC